MPNTPMTNKTGRSLAKLILIGMAVQLMVIGYVFYQSYQGRADVVSNQRAGCERGKLDREDNAEFQVAQKDYILKVTSAVSVKEDVKAAARQAAKTFEKTSARLTRRAMIDCTTAYPKASFLP